MFGKYGIEVCRCKAAMRARWSRDAGPKVYMCIRCGRLVPGYERLWWEREKMKEKEGNPSQPSKFCSGRDVS